MGTMDNLVHATKIHTNGLMRGSWNRMTSDKTPSQIFQSDSHPDYTLKFTQAWLVEIKNDAEEIQYTYCWDATEGQLTETGAPQEDLKLSVELLRVEVKKNKNCEIIADLARANEESQSKIDDLNKQVLSFQYICCGQQEKIKNLLEKLKGITIRVDKEDKNSDIDQPPFIHNVSGKDISKRPQKPSQLLAQYESNNNLRSVPPPAPFGPIIQHPNDPNVLPPRTYGPLSYGGHVGPFRGFDPYFPNMPHLAFNHPMPWTPPTYDHYYGAPILPVSYPPFLPGPPPIIPEPPGMRAPQRVDGQMSLYGPPTQQPAPMGAPVAGENLLNAPVNRPRRRDLMHRQIINTDLNVNEMSKKRHDESKMEQKPTREHNAENQFNPVAELPFCVENQKPKDSVPRSAPFNKPEPEPQPSPIKSQIQSQSKSRIQSQNSTGLIMGPHDPAGDEILRKFQLDSGFKKS